METLIIIALILAGLLLFAVEVFLVPGITLAGIASGISLLYAIYYAFHSVGTQAGFITLAVEAVGIIGITIWFMRSKTVGINIQAGDTGMSLTRLTLIGNAEINGHIIEVQSADGFIEERTPIQVTRINNGTVYVTRYIQQ